MVMVVVDPAELKPMSKRERQRLLRQITQVIKQLEEEKREVKRQVPEFLFEPRQPSLVEEEQEQDPAETARLVAETISELEAQQQQGKPQKLDGEK